MSLSAINVSLALSDTPLLNAINLSVQPGKITTVLGPNGAGKTSLLRALVGELPPDAGSVSLNGRALDEWTPIQRAAMLAVLPQHSLLNFPFTAAEVVMLGRTRVDWHTTGRSLLRHCRPSMGTISRTAFIHSSRAVKNSAYTWPVCFRRSGSRPAMASAIWCWMSRPHRSIWRTRN